MLCINQDVRTVGSGERAEVRESRSGARRARFSVKIFVEVVGRATPWGNAVRARRLADNDYHSHPRQMIMIIIITSHIAKRAPTVRDPHYETHFHIMKQYMLP